MSQSLQEVMNLWSRGDRSAALALSARAFHDQPDNEELVLFHSGLLLHHGDFAQACAVLDKIVAHRPDSARLMVNLSIARRGSGDLEGAVAAAQAAVEKAPELVSAWNALGIALIEVGRLDEAERRLSEGLAQHPDCAPLSLHLDQVIQKQGKQRGEMRNHGLALMAQADALVQGGNSVAAETLLRQALKLYPNHSSAHTNLGVFLMQFERNAEAAEAFRAALERRPDCSTSRYLLQVVEGDTPETGSAKYVQMLFDSYADRFDEHLVETLEYRVPELLADRVLSRAPDNRLGEVLDLGCGTGLMADHLADRSTALDGVDLSSRMLEKARERGLYRKLVEADIREYLGDVSASWHVILAADVFCYCGWLDDILDMAKLRLEPRGLLAFTVEVSEARDVEVVAVTGRYRHGRDYLLAALARAGFNNSHIERAVLRKNSNQDVEGYIVLAQA